MYNLTIHFGPNAVAWSFLFKTKESIEKIRGELYVENVYPLRVIDDYGQEAEISRPIHGWLIEDTEAGTEARILRGLDNARGQARANKRASTDPELQQLQRGQGPSVITPFANGGFRQ
jgi:hypothetical protein